MIEFTVPEYSVDQYVRDLRAIRNTGAATAETSFYPPIDRLFNTAGESLKPKVLFSTQLRNQGAGMPDGGFFLQPRRSRNTEPPPLHNPERGVVEIKPAGYDLDQLAREEQTLRYLRQYGLVLITNLHEFRLLALDAAGQPRTLERYALADSENSLWHQNIDPRHNGLLPDFLRRVMVYRAPLSDPKELAWLLASYAREARARAEDHPLASFDAVRTALQESLGIQFEGEKGAHFFRSTLVQTLFYGIFSAWILWHRAEGRTQGERFDWRLSAYHLRVPVLRQLFNLITDPGPLNAAELPEILNLAGDALNRVQPAFFDTFRTEQAVTYFYEPFLKAFDPVLRKDLGVWYTPREVVHYMVERVDQLLRSELNQPLGLASPNVRILDPCCGTGAFLTAVLHRIHRTLIEQAGEDTALVPHHLRQSALTRVFGFEIMPAPFVIAHMEVAALLEEAGAPLTGHTRAGVYLTNALTGWVPVRHPQAVIFPEMEQEREASEQIKQHGSILVILGNPPYNGFPGIATIEEERNLSEDYRAHIQGVKQPEGHGLNELYVRFFRIAERRIAQNPEGRGIVSFISNYSWLDGLSHPTMRHHYLYSFSQIFIDNLNGDARRTGKRTPEGLPDPSIFSTPLNREGIQVGTAITTLIRAAARYTDSVHLRNLWGTGKLAQLESESKHEAEPVYEALQPEPALGLPFAIRVQTIAYTSWPALPELFPKSYPGVKTSRDSLVVDIDRDRLEARMKNYVSEEVVHKTLQERGFRPWQIVRFTYRPFDTRWLYWEKKETRLLDREREEFQAQFVGYTTWVEARQRESDDIFARGTVVRGLADNFGNGLSNFFPAVVLEETLLSEDQCRANLSDASEAYLGSIHADHTDIFFHALAIMHTPQYRAENSGALLSDWPRIPLPATAELLSRSAILGRRLAELLDAESEVSFAAPWKFLGRLSLPTPANFAEHLKLSAPWGYFQGTNVMPGPGQIVARPWTEAELARLNALAELHSFAPEQALAILGVSAVDVYLNGAASWVSVPVKVWEYKLGGYQVLKKWLSYRQLDVLARPLHPEEAEYFSAVVRRIAAILLLGPALDASYAAILPSAITLPTR
jgi:Type ISP C-terminal specificity domain/N-6 DNA Methylase